MYLPREGRLGRQPVRTTVRIGKRLVYGSGPWQKKNRFVLEERPQSEVYTTDSGFIGIRQEIRGEETILLFTLEETEKIIGYLKECVHKLRRNG